MRLEKCWKCSPPTRLAACLSESLTSGVKGYARLCASPSFTGLDWHLRTRRIDNGSISRHSEARRHVRSGSQPAGSSSAAPGWPTMAKKKKRERRKAQKSVLQRRCGAFGAFLENLNSVSSTCAFGFFFFSLCCSQGLGFRRGARAFSMSETVLLCRRSVRVCAASATIRVRDGWSICAEACLLIVAPPCRSRWWSRTWESRLEWLERGVQI